MITIWQAMERHAKGEDCVSMISHEIYRNVSMAVWMAEEICFKGVGLQVQDGWHIRPVAEACGER